MREPIETAAALYPNRAQIRPKSAVLPPVRDLNWRIVETADFNADGKPDILWRNTATGANAIWFLNGTTVISSAALIPVSDTNWSIVGPK